MEIVLAGVVAVGLGGIGMALRKQAGTLDQIHTLVNSRLTEALEDIAALKAALLDERRSAELAALTRSSRKKG